MSKHMRIMFSDESIFDWQRRYHEIPNHIPDEQLKRYVRVRAEKDLYKEK